jgi:uncharacterized membrane protein
MPFLICDECGGYYELQRGESPEDFESCLCGGNLTYMESNPEKTLNHKSKNVGGGNEKDDILVKESEILNSICPNCLKEDESGLFCSVCGGKLLQMKNGKVINKKEPEYSLDDYSLTKTVQKKTKVSNIPPEQIKGPKSFLKRIKWLGVSAGSVFLIITLLIVFYSLYSTLYFNYYSYGDINYQGFEYFFNILIIALLLLGVSAGALTIYINKDNDPLDGLLNGFMVGAMSSVILGVYESLTYSFIGGILIILIGIPILGSLSSVGGLIVTIIQNKLKIFR